MIEKTAMAYEEFNNMNTSVNGFTILHNFLKYKLCGVTIE